MKTLFRELASLRPCWNLVWCAGTLSGYVNFTLSYFNTSELDRGVSRNTGTANTTHPAICRWDQRTEGVKENWWMFTKDIPDISTHPGLRTSTSTIRSFGRSGLPVWPLWSSSRPLSLSVFSSSGTLEQWSDRKSQLLQIHSYSIHQAMS